MNMRIRIFKLILITAILKSICITGTSEAAFAVKLVGGIRGLVINFSLNLGPAAEPRLVHIRFLLDEIAFWRTEQIPGTQKPSIYPSEWAQFSIGHLWSGFSWSRVCLTRQGKWCEQIMLQRPVTPGIHHVKAEVYLIDEILPSDNKERGSVPEGWEPILVEEDTLIIKKVEIPKCAGQVLISSVPFGGRVYIAKGVSQGDLYDSRFFKGVTPLFLSLNPGDYLVGIELQGTTPDLMWEDDGCLNTDVVDLSDSGIWYRRTYTLHVDSSVPTVLIALFQKLHVGFYDLLYILPKERAFPIRDLKALRLTLAKYGISSRDIENLIKILERGGKVVWKDRFCPIPWLFMDQYQEVIMSYCPEGTITFISKTFRLKTLHIPSIVIASNDAKLLLNLLLLPEIGTPKAWGISSFGPIYKAFTEWPTVYFYHNNTPFSEREKKMLYEKMLTSLLSARSTGNWLEVARFWKKYLSGEFLHFILLKVEAMSKGDTRFKNLAPLSLNSLAIDLGKLIFPKKDFLGLAYLQRGRIYLCESEPVPNKALSSFQTALSYFEKPPINWIGVSLAATELGNLLFERYRKFEDAEFYYAKALNACRNTHWGLSVALDNMARVCLVLGKYEQALKLIQAKREIAKREIEQSPSWAQSEEMELFIFSASMLGKYTLIKDILDEQLDPLRYQPSWEVGMQANLLETGAKWYLHIGLTQEAVAWFTELAKHDRAKGLLGLGQTLFANGDYIRALHCFEEAFQSDPETPPSPASAGAEALMYIAHIYAFMGDVKHYITIVNLLERTLMTYAQVTSYIPWFAKIHRHLGFSAYVLGLYENAQEHLDIAIAFDIKMGAKEELWHDYLLLGLLNEEKGYIDEALAAYREAIQIIESIRVYMKEDFSKRLFLHRRRLAYEKFIKLLLSVYNDVRKAFIVVEQCRSRSFLDLIAKGPIESFQNIAEEGIKTGFVEPEKIQADLEEVVANLPTDTAVLEYFVTDKTTYVWVIIRGEVSKPVIIEIDRSDLLEKVLAFREAIETTPKTGEETIALLGVLNKAQELYKLLVQPVEKKIKGYKHLVIVPSGPLYYVPFSALYICPNCEGEQLLGGHYLVEDFSLSFLPSLVTLKYVWGGRSQTPSNLFAVANPVHPPFSSLPEAEEEAKKIAALFPRAEVYTEDKATEEVVRSRATATRAQYLLFSTHGSFNPYNPMFSFLVLTPTGKAPESDGKLHTYEVFELDLKADLVTMSACETLLPSIKKAERETRALRGIPEEEPVELPLDLLERIVAGDEMAGLTRAFFSAGASSVLASLWSVPSKATEELMVKFFSYLQEGMDLAEALQAAQKDIIRKGREEIGLYWHPWNWAAFQLYGNWK